MEERKTHIIDAQGKTLGRLATKIAILLQGKHKPNFRPERDMGDFVIVKNLDKIRFPSKKDLKKKYFFHSGYIGHWREITLKDLFKKNPEKVLKMAVYGMLPKNRLRKRMIKRLKVEK
jgi:large subunit ribosomal protein L13